MEKPIIEVKGLGKQYRLGQSSERYTALRDVIMNVVKHPFSFAKDKAKMIAGLKEQKEFWALRDVEFSINRGEVIGVIGANGAGKSTLLKILTGITPPTTGEAILRGRVSSLLEVGTGFHPELTGRENVYLNGAILGMSKREMDAKFDEIVEFAGIEQFLDTPVKRYSSGMYVRLAFSVAAHLEPDILLVDEVLAVGDAEFQKKCLGKMEEVTSKAGRTILFVSHNMGAIEQLCKKSILLEKGEVVMFDETSKVVERYLRSSNMNAELDKMSRQGDGKIRLTRFHIEDRAGNEIKSIQSGEDAVLVFSYASNDPADIKKVDAGFSLSKNGVLISKFYSSYANAYFNNIRQEGSLKLLVRNIHLNTGDYEVGVRLLADGIESDWPKGAVGTLTVHQGDFYGSGVVTPSDGTVLMRAERYE